jgi:hypothetical protein
MREHKTVLRRTLGQGPAGQLHEQSRLDRGVRSHGARPSRQLSRGLVGLSEPLGHAFTGPAVGLLIGHGQPDQRELVPQPWRVGTECDDLVEIGGGPVPLARSGQRGAAAFPGRHVPRFPARWPRKMPERSQSAGPARPERFPGEIRPPRH